MILDGGYSAVTRVDDPSAIGEARRTAVALARALDFGDTDRENVSIVATEMATNLVKHGGGGEIVTRLFERAGAAAIELVALDTGPGMSNVAACFADGFSTAGSPGTGLGAISRLATEVDVSTAPGCGTALVARLWSTKSVDRSGPRIGAVCLPKRGEEACGDAWMFSGDDERAVVMVADGLGHGPLAAAASVAAVEAFRGNVARAPGAILEAAHGALRSTRGAAVAVAEIDFGARAVRFAGVGNIAGAVVALGGSRQMVSHNGTVGAEARRVQEFVYPFPAGARLVLHSDGLGSQWRIESYPGLLRRDPSLVAGTLYRDFARGRDDVTVFVLAESEEAA
jgi:anti-sigma regulatory factor (Ser/Thr protein kinase)